MEVKFLPAEQWRDFRFWVKLAILLFFHLFLIWRSTVHVQQIDLFTMLMFGLPEMAAMIVVLSFLQRGD